MSLGRGQRGQIHFAAYVVQRQQSAVDATLGAVHGHFLAIQGAQRLQALNADDGRNAQFTRGNGRVAGVAAHIGHDGGRHAHAGHHVRIGAFGGQNIALGHFVQLQGGT